MRAAQEQWDDAAATFDEEADHGLRDPACRAAWGRLLESALPPVPSRVADLGCGTGSLTRLLTDLGHRVTGVDFSPAMVRLARAKAPEATLLVGDAAAPPLAEGAYDVVLSRHVLWAVPDPEETVAAWVRLLAPAGRLVLVEGRWHTGAGLEAAETAHAVRRVREEALVQQLPDPVLWGGSVSDERYLLLSRS